MTQNIWYFILKYLNIQFTSSHFSLSFCRCFSEESCLSLRQLEGYLVVLQPDAPQISLSGVGPHLARPAAEFEGPQGVPLFPELRIVCSLSHAVNTAAQGMEGGGKLWTSHLKLWTHCLMDDLYMGFFYQNEFFSFISGKWSLHQTT